MKWWKKSLMVIWTIWGAIVFFGILALYMPVVIFPAIINNERLKDYVWQSLRFIARFILFLWGIRIEIRNKHLRDAKGQFVYVPNHRSYLDAVVASACIPNRVKYLGKAEILKWPLVGFILKHYHIAVKRNDAGSRSLSLEQMDALVKSGASLCIFPEGTCNTTTDLLKKFHEGAFKIAVPNQIPLVPLTFIGTGELMPRSGFLLKPGKVIVYWNEPISTTGYSLADIPDLVYQVREALISNLKKHYPHGYA
jgi:1-acyl-sn-glycerol-3-phosphate acyltransferase